MWSAKQERRIGRRDIRNGKGLVGTREKGGRLLEFLGPSTVSFASDIESFKSVEFVIDGRRDVGRISKSKHDRRFC